MPLRSALLALLVVLSAPAICGTAEGRSPVAYRPVSFKSNDNCVEEKAGRREVYMVSPFHSAWPVGASLDVEVVEFYSGRRYHARLLTAAERRGELRSRHGTVALDCSVNMVFDASTPVSADGSYLSFVNIARDGSYGPDADLDAGDIGRQGIVRYRPDGSIAWGVVILVRDRRVKGHPIYKVPGWYQIRDREFVSSRLLDDSLLLVYANQFAFRVDLSTGALLSAHDDVRSIPLTGWAKAKAAAFASTYGLDCSGESPPPSTAPRPECDPGTLDKRYLDSLKNYLFYQPTP